MEEDQGFEPLSGAEEVESSEYKQAWARLLAKVYEVDPFVCPFCGSELKVIAVIQDAQEIKTILAHLLKIGRAPPGLDPASRREILLSGGCVMDRPISKIRPAATSISISVPSTMNMRRWAIFFFSSFF